ncbi:cryptochrome/photolyase family protein [Microtetraspora niveoalba]|uniref:cryptochrome/photolyase family protein n=1 Tax=Microtetraspora niveoalba TaxID=46175 RepID=UPI00082D2A9F|nr:deoxyribodipyrimidine photo-lyase [Microtetraspora niveoalba]
MDTVIVLFTRDLRVRDHPALSAACDRGGRVVPLFVLDPEVPAGHRTGFLLDCLADLRESLRALRGDLFLRRGDVVTETMRLAGEVGADAIYASSDVSELGRRRERRLAGERVDLRLFPGLTVVPPGALRPSGGGDHYRVFTPYWRAWAGGARRAVLPAPSRVPAPPGLVAGDLPAHASRPVLKGGETAARARLDVWLRQGLNGYAEGRDDLAGDRTSRLSPYLRFGCVSPLELADLAGSEPEFVRQLCWRDFFHQVTLAFPRINRDDYRSRPRRWRDAPDAVSAWKAGTTGVPIVDAGMRQLLAEGWMHNRARMIVADYLVNHLGVDWRVGAAHFFDLLLDGDVANNSGNWQWVAGTGNSTRPGRVLNPVRQARRFDPDAAYIRRYVPELAGRPAAEAREPWRLSRRVSGYPAPLDPVDRRR